MESLHQKKEEIKRLKDLAQEVSDIPTFWRKTIKAWWYCEVLLRHSLFVVLKFKPWNHARQKLYPMKFLFGVTVWDCFHWGNCREFNRMIDWQALNSHIALWCFNESWRKQKWNEKMTINSHKGKWKIFWQVVIEKNTHFPWFQHPCGPVSNREDVECYPRIYEGKFYRLINRNSAPPPPTGDSIFVLLVLSRLLLNWLFQDIATIYVTVYRTYCKFTSLSVTQLGTWFITCNLSF